MGAVYDDTYDDQMVYLYVEVGWSLRQIGLKFNYSSHAVAHHLRQNGVCIRPRGSPPGVNRLPNSVIDRTVYLSVVMNYTDREIAEAEGVSKETIRDRLKRYHADRRSREEAALIAWQTRTNTRPLDSLLIT